MTTSYMYQAGYASVMEKLAVSLPWIKQHARNGALTRRSLHGDPHAALPDWLTNHHAAEKHIAELGTAQRANAAFPGHFAGEAAAAEAARGKRQAVKDALRDTWAVPSPHP